MYDVKEHTLDSLQTHLHKHWDLGYLQCPWQQREKRHIMPLRTFQEIQNAVQFLTHYANQHGIPQPAGPRGGDSDPPIFLPCSDTTEMIHKHYSESCIQSDLRALGHLSKTSGFAVPLTSESALLELMCVTSAKITEVL